MANVSNYTEQGGERTVIGGSLDVVSGAEVDIESGGALKIAGVAVSAGAAELNILDGVTATAAELNKLDGAGAVVPSGTEESLISDIATDANGTAIATAVNALIDALQAFGIVATE